MDVRETIVLELTDIFEEDELEVPEFEDDLVLLDTELDSLGYAVLVTRLEDRLGYDPFVLSEDPTYPSTFGEFVAFYEKFSSHAKQI